MAKEMPDSDWSDLGSRAHRGARPTLTIQMESGGEVVSQKEMLNVVIRGENDAQQAKVIDVHYTPHPRQD